MTQLLPCPSCSRHVRQNEDGCPFCGTPLDLASIAPRAMPTQRLGRAALSRFGGAAFGAAMATSVAACGGGVVPLYGAPADTGTDATVSPVYGGPSTDAGIDGGGPAPAYGAPTDASANDGSPAALYGAVPAPDTGTDAA